MKKNKENLISAIAAASLSLASVLSPLSPAVVYADESKNIQKAETTDASSKLAVSLTDENKGNSVTNNFNITNQGQAVDLSQVKIRYYYKCDTDEQQFNCYNADITSSTGNYTSLTDKVTGSITNASGSFKNADSYMEISFAKSTLNTGDVLKLTTALNNSNWQNFNSKDDYSFNDASKIVVLVNDKIVSGTVPSEKDNARDCEDYSISLKEDGIDKENIVNPEITVTNTGNCDLSLDDIRLMYYYTADNDDDYDYSNNKNNNSTETFKCPYAAITTGEFKDLTSSVVGKIEKVSYESADADRCLTLSFSDCSLKPGESLKIQTAVNKADWSIYDKTNDFSYNDASHVCGYGYLFDGYQSFHYSTGLSPQIYASHAFNGHSEPIADSQRSAISKDEPEITFLDSSKNKQIVVDQKPITFNITNTSNVDMDLNLLNLYYFYSKVSTDLCEKFIITSAKAADKDLTQYTSAVCNFNGAHFDSDPLPCAAASSYGNKIYYLYDAKTSFNENAGTLKPGEILTVTGYFDRDSSADSNLDTKKYRYSSPVVTYDDESVYGSFPKGYDKDPELLTKKIELPAESKNTDTAISLKLNSNYLSSIYSIKEGEEYRPLIKGEDYVLNKRNEVVLKKSYLDKLESSYTLLKFKFDNGYSENLTILNNKPDLDYSEGTLKISCDETTYDNYQGGSIVIPISLKDLQTERISKSSILLNYDQELFEYAEVEILDRDMTDYKSYNGYTRTGTINFPALDKDILKADKSYTIARIKLHPRKTISCPQDIHLTLSPDSYYQTLDGKKYRLDTDFKTIELR